ncbi:hypothetical protein XI05_08825 [Bradyrhizobium sp. CCBAU 11357]|nr:hypothetical protein [Bradyrhizobium sp. CCBAU 11357]
MTRKPKTASTFCTISEFFGFEPDMGGGEGGSFWCSLSKGWERETIEREETMCHFTRLRSRDLFSRDLLVYASKSFDAVG